VHTRTHMQRQHNTECRAVTLPTGRLFRPARNLKQGSASDIATHTKVSILSSLRDVVVLACMHSWMQAEWLAQRLSAAGFPCAYLAGGVAQERRMEIMEALRAFELRVGGGAGVGQSLRPGPGH
jgi:hypothetical protein